jgi:hypothetical protein
MWAGPPTLPPPRASRDIRKVEQLSSRKRGRRAEDGMFKSEIRLRQQRASYGGKRIWIRYCTIAASSAE